jgi:hypothetical protein
LSTPLIASKCINDKQHITTAKVKEPHKAHQQNSQTYQIQRKTTQHIPHIVHHRKWQHTTPSSNDEKN